MVKIVVLGAGVAGGYAAWKLAAAGHQVTLIDKLPYIGGLASSFQQYGRYYPLGYHQILAGDLFLHQVLKELELFNQVQWRKVKMLFWYNGRAYDLGKPVDALRFPLEIKDKFGLAKLIAVTKLRSHWDSLSGIDAASWLDKICGVKARQTLFEPLIFSKFGLEAKEVSAAWLGGRLHGNEAKGDFGYIPGTDWTRLMAEGLTRQCEKHNVQFKLGQNITKLVTSGELIKSVTTQQGETIEADIIVSTLPTPTLKLLLSLTADNPLHKITYTGVISCVAEMDQPPVVQCYWLNMLSPKVSCGGIFTLSELNPSLGYPGKYIINFVTHCGEAVNHPLFKKSDEEIFTTYAADYQKLFSRPLKVNWYHISKLESYSPRFVVGYQNPPLQLPEFTNLYLCGHYRTYPQLTSTGMAMQSADVLVKHLLSPNRHSERSEESTNQSRSFDSVPPTA